MGNTSESWDGYYYVPVETTLDRYAEVNGCAKRSWHFETKFDGKGKRNTGLLRGCAEWNGCASGARVVLCEFDGEHGIWPAYAEELMWSFLSTLQPTPSPSPAPTPVPTPSPAPSPIPGGEPSEDCLECWQTACSASKQAGCQQCMKDSKESCIAICKPSLFGQKMMDWFCKSDLEVVV